MHLNRRFRYRRSDSILGTFFGDSLLARIFLALITFGSQIENKGSLRVKESVL